MIRDISHLRTLIEMFEHVAEAIHELKTDTLENVKKSSNATHHQNTVHRQ